MDLDSLCRRIEAVWSPGNFLLRELRAAWQFDPAETVPWEIFRGALLPAAHCRTSRTFLAWNVRPLEGDTLGPEPLLSVKLDPLSGDVHVLRGILCRRWETVETAPGLPEERETSAWTRELVGTLRPPDHPPGDLDVELAELLHQAVVGTSRLPLTSLEAPLPGFLFGRLHHLGLPDPAEEPPRWASTTWQAVLDRRLQPEGDASKQAKLVECAFRAATDNDEAAAVAGHLHRLWLHRGGSTAGMFRILRTLFGEISLSPWTGFVPRLFAGLDHLASSDPVVAEERLDFHADLVRLLDRHLTAYDLITYHHRGANYPDALLLEAILERLLDAADRSPEVFLRDAPAALRRRRALRQALLLRRHYRNLPVPETPTSPGERLRILPEALPLVPEEQILQTRLRPRRLFADPLPKGRLTPPVGEVLRTALEDLGAETERLELGKAIFLERPLGEGKAPGEPDRTPLLSYLACSRAIALRRLRETTELAGECGLDSPLDRSLADPVGIPIERIAPSRRPTVALADAAAVSPDFRVARTLRRSLQPLLDHLGPLCPDWARLEPTLLARVVAENGGSTPIWFDASFQPRCLLEMDDSEGYRLHRGREFPRRGVRLLPVQ